MVLRSAEVKRRESLASPVQMQTAMRSVVAPVGVRFRHLDHHVYGELLNAIIDGRLAPGTRLVLDDLADQLKVSRTPIRDALGRLSSEGLVRRVGRQGLYGCLTVASGARGAVRSALD